MLWNIKMKRVIKGGLFFALLPFVFLTHAVSIEERSVSEFQEGINEIHSQASKPDASKEVKELSGSIRQAEESKRDYEKHKLNAWAYRELAKCNKIPERDFEDYFIRYMKSKYPSRLNLIYSDASMAEMYANRFFKEEYTPKARDYYIDTKRCPKLEDLNFNFN
ncbi:hypothetical protein [Serratia fonticola]|jgi:hypothetical protein